MSRCLTFFVTGTDTGVGKTRVTLGMMQALQEAGYRVSGMKPVASGARMIDGRLQNDDAVLIQSHCSQPCAYEQVNPYALSKPVAPNFAAELDGVPVSLDVITSHATRFHAGSDCLFIEGIGGWLAPWGDDLFAEDLVARLGSKVILVVGLRPGCLNHAMLTIEAMLHDGVQLAGWLANCIEPEYECMAESIEYLTRRIQAPLIGDLPWFDNPSPGNVSRYIDMAPICPEAGVARSGE